MSELPKGWVKAKLGRYIYLKNGYAFKSHDYVEPNGNTVPVIRISDIDGEYASDKKSNHVPVDKAVSGFEVMIDYLLVAMSGATTGKIGIYKGIVPAFQNQRVGNFKLNAPDICNAGFRNHLIRYLSPTILEIAYGGAQPNISASGIEELDVDFPPLAEQKRIVEKLDQVLAQVDTIKARLDGIPAILKRFRQSVLAAAVSGKLTEEWGGASDTNWNRGCLGDFIQKPSYGSSTKSSKTGQVPVLRMGNLQNGKLDWTDLVYTSDKKEIAKYNLQKGDVLFNRTNSPELVGKTSIYRGEREAIYAGYLIRVKCLSSLNSEYLNYFLNSPRARSYCKSVKTDGVSQSNINAKKLSEFPFSCPPMNEQTEIVRLVDQYFAFADTIEKQVQKAQQRVDKLTQSILAKAFRGELVPQDPDDEPADELLKRIATARAESEALAKAAKKVGKRK